MIKKIAEHIFTYEYTAKLIPGILFPVTSSLIELHNNELMIISPGPFEEKSIRNFIDKYNCVYCVAPNALHHQHLQRFNDFFPEIKIYGPPSLINKQPWLSEKMMTLDTLKEKLSDQILFIAVQGNDFLEETVFYYQRSKSLIVTDLFFNMREPLPFGLKCLLTLVDARNKIAQSKLVKKSTKDNIAYANSIKPLGNLDYQRIIVGHGNTITETAEIKKALEVIGAI